MNSKESLGSGRLKPASTVSSKPSTSILAKAGAPCSATSASRVVHGTSMVWSHTWPSQPPAPSAARDEIGRGGGDGGIGRVDPQRQLAGLAPHADSTSVTSLIARVDRADRARAQRLRLQRHHARAETAKAADAVADVAADVEGEIAGADEAGIQRIHRRIARRIAVVDIERPAQRCERGVGAQG